MGILLISLLTVVLILISLFVVLIVLMQRTSQSGGMGAALGGGAAESAFGSETNTILTKGTIYGIIAFFVVALGLFLLYQGQVTEREAGVDPALLGAGDVSVPADAADGTETAGGLSPAVEPSGSGGAAVPAPAPEGSPAPVSADP